MSHEPNAPQETTEITTSLPVADKRKRGGFLKKLVAQSRMWILTLVCVIVAIVLLLSALVSSGRQITIVFTDGYGIKPGDTLRYRGIDVGEVSDVSVDRDLSGVTVKVELQSSASELAVEGSRFWIERPQLGLSRVSGLETVVGAKFIGVIPGARDGPPQWRFTGIDSPPVLRSGTATEIRITFRDGHGIRIGDVVKHLGIVVGEVAGIELNTELDRVLVQVRLANSAAGLARTGSQFWIERPQLGLSGVRGLETLIQGQYIAVLPGPSDGEVNSDFIGLPQPPPKTRSGDGLEITLYADQRRALGAGVPIHYRGVAVGHIISVGLATDSSTVQARAYIEPEYKPLVRANTRFWSHVGIEADFSVRGLQINTDSLQSIVTGSVSFATPEQYTRRARTGDRFQCAARVDAQWLEWNPQIALGIELLPQGSEKPAVQRSVVRWEKALLTFRRESQRQGWLVWMTGGRLFGLGKFVTPDESAIEGTVFIEIAGAELRLDPSQLRTMGNLAAVDAAEIELPGIEPWPEEKVRRPTAAEDCVVVADPQAAVIPVSSNIIDAEQDADRWLIKRSIALDNTLDGACVVSRIDGSIIGFLTFDKGRAVVELVPKEFSLSP